MKVSLIMKVLADFVFIMVDYSYLGLMILKSETELFKLESDK